MAPARIVPALDEAEDRHLRRGLGIEARRARSSHSSVAKKLSHMALSYASPTEPIDGGDAGLPGGAEGEECMAALIGVMDDVARPALAERHVEGVEDELAAEVLGHRPADNAAAERVQHDGR